MVSTISWPHTLYRLDLIGHNSGCKSPLWSKIDWGAFHDMVVVLCVVFLHNMVTVLCVVFLLLYIIWWLLCVCQRLYIIKK